MKFHEVVMLRNKYFVLVKCSDSSEIKPYKIDGEVFKTNYKAEAQELADKLNGVKC